MYAIVEIAGQQFKVEEGKKIFVHRLDTGKDTVVEFDKVLLVEESGNVLVGEPVVGNFIVEGKVIDHVKGDKVIVFKKKRKKGYRVKNGHRQRFTQIEIIGIGEKGSIVRKETQVKERVKKATEPAVIDETATEVKKTPQKKSTAKKPVKKEAEVTPKVKKTAGEKTAEKKPAAKKITKKKE